MNNIKVNKISNMLDYCNQDMISDIQHFASSSNIKTGYANLDNITSLYPGLYVLGAISSLGKTTFIHQMCDQLAQNGQHVIYFSFEQSTLELATKSLSRIMAMQKYQTALTSLQIRKSVNDPNILTAIDVYKTYANYLTVVECSFDTTIQDVEEYVTAYINTTGIRPVVVIDYLQVIQCNNSHATTKDITDMHVKRLKQLQRDNNLILIVISSLNRANYLSQIDYESYKESGGIEYTADVVWGLQLKILHDPIFDKQGDINNKRQKAKDAKAAIPREIELICLKNRFGISSYNCDYIYYPQFDWFLPVVNESK